MCVGSGLRGSVFWFVEGGRYSVMVYQGQCLLFGIYLVYTKSGSVTGYCQATSVDFLGDRV